MNKTLWVVVSAALVLSAPAARADWKKDASNTETKTENHLKSGAHKAKVHTKSAAHKTKVKTDAGAHKLGEKAHKAEDKTGKHMEHTGAKMQETHPSPSPTTSPKNP